MRAAKAVSYCMLCAVLVSAAELLLASNFSLFSLGLMLGAPSIALLIVMFVLRILQTIDAPANAMEGAWLAALHTGVTASTGAMLATAMPSLAQDPATSAAFVWASPLVWLSLLATQAVLLAVLFRR